MLNWIKSKIWNKTEPEIHTESVETLPSTLAGSQRSVEVEQNQYLIPTFGLTHPFNLNDYLTLYANDALAYALVAADVNLTVSEFEFYSERDEVNEYLCDLHARLDMDRVVWEIARDNSLYGFATNEIAGNNSTLLNSTEVLAIKRIDPRYMYLVKSPLGRVVKWLQRPLYNSVYTQQVYHSDYFGRELSAESIIYCHSLSPLTSYGQSILQPLKARLASLNDLIDATTTAHQKHANAVIWLKYVADKEKDEIAEEIAEKVAAMKAATEDIDTTGTRWMHSGGTGEFHHSILAAEELPDAAPLISNLTKDVIVAAGFNPAVFGYGEGDKESSRYTVNSIITRQRTLMSQLHARLYSILPFVDSECPANSADEIRVRMKAPTQETVKEMLESEAIKINNVGLKLRMGAISETTAAQELDLETWNDSDRLKDWLDKPQPETNPNDPNQTQQVRKGLDSLNDGKTPSNNPSGKEQ